jgi:hypothetical protein
MRGHCFDLGGYHGRVIRSVNLFHYMLFFLVTHPRDAGDIGHALNEFEQRQLVEWTPKAEDFLKHDDENRTHDGVFGRYRGEDDNYSTSSNCAGSVLVRSAIDSSRSGHGA